MSVEAPASGRVLVVDDEANVRAVLCHYLREARYETREAVNGTEAIKVAGDWRPDIVLLDLTMPGMDGLDACTRIKAEPKLAATQVIVCTARTSKQDLIQAIRAGADDYIAKPFQRDTVLVKVERARQRGQTPRPGFSPIASDRRGAPRKPARWNVSWQAMRCHSAFKCRVIDISLRGLAFEFPGCGVCTQGDASGVEPHFPHGTDLELVLAISKDVVLETAGHVAHVEPIPGRPGAEKVGIEFAPLPPYALELIQQFVDGKLEL